MQFNIQWEPESSGIGRLLLDSLYDFEYSKEEETQKLCSVNRPISQLTSDLQLASKCICFLTTLNTLQLL